MHPDPITITNLFNMSRQYAIPIFQRGYVWTLEKQVVPLWFDILDRSNEYIERQRLLKENNIDESNLRPLSRHFLGSVVISRMDRKDTLSVESFEVIDGQQRMTTLHIFLKCLYDIAVFFNNEKLPKKILGLLKNGSESGNDVYKIWPTQAGIEEVKLIDASYSVEKIAEDTVLPKKPRQKNCIRPLMIETYLYFFGSILSFIQKKPVFDEEKESDDLIHRIRKLDVPIQISEKTEEEKAYSIQCLEALFATVQSLMYVMLLSLDKDDDPQVIFETLNARGEPLLASDLIRNFVFLNAAQKKLKQDTLYENYWNVFDSNDIKDGVVPSKYWRVLERQGRLNHPRIDLFFYNYLIVSKTEETKATAIFTSFKEWWLSENRDTEKELQRLIKVAKYFQQYVTPSKEDVSHSANFARMLKALDVSTFVPTYLFLKEYFDGKNLNDDYEKCLDYIESYLVRRTVCDLTAKNYNKLSLRLLASVKEYIAKSYHEQANDSDVSNEDSSEKKISYAEILQQKTPLSSFIKEFLESLDGESTKWPNDDEFKHAWLHKPAYVYMKNRKVLPILKKINESLITKKQEKVVLPEALTIEHVLPQTYTEKYYPLPICKEEDLQKVKDERWNLLNSFGNLTLLTQSLNSSVSNGAFHPYINEKGEQEEGKRKAICRQSLLQLNTYFQDLTDVEWDNDQIQTRGNILFEKAKVLWGK